MFSHLVGVVMMRKQRRKSIKNSKKKAKSSIFASKLIDMMSKDDFRQVVAEFYDKWQSSNETAKKLDEVKFYRGIVVGLIIGIVGSLLSSFKTLNNVLICVGIGAVMVLVMILVPLTLQINDKIKEMKGV